MTGSGWEDEAPDCPRCRQPNLGCAWGPARVCLACHEASLLPPGVDEVAGIVDSRTGRDTTDWEAGS
jgi:hypothetical protein